MRMKGKKFIFSYKDTWDLRSTLAPCITEGLKKFKEVNNEVDYGGYPSSLSSMEEWEEVLDKIIYAFDDNTPDITDYAFHYIFGEGHGEETPEGFHKWNMVVSEEGGDELKRYEDDLQKHQEKVKEGLELFAKHFEDFWW